MFNIPLYDFIVQSMDTQTYIYIRMPFPKFLLQNPMPFTTKKEYCVHYTVLQYSVDSDLVFLAVLSWKKYLFKENTIKQKKMLGTLLS